MARAVVFASVDLILCVVVNGVRLADGTPPAWITNAKPTAGYGTGTRAVNANE